MTYPNLPIKPGATAVGRVAIWRRQGLRLRQRGGPEALDAGLQTKTIAMMSV